MNAAATPPDFDVELSCSGTSHRIEVRAGRARAAAEHGVEEDVLRALGAEGVGCAYVLAAMASAPLLLSFYEQRLAGGMALRADQLAAMAPGLGEPRVDARRVPPALRRLAAVEGRATGDAVFTSQANDPVSVDFRLRTFAGMLARAAVSPRTSLTFVVGDAPAVETPAAGEPVVSLAPDWLQTTFVLGLTGTGGLLTIGSRIDPPDVVLTELHEDNGVYVAAQRRLPISQALVDLSLVGFGDQK